MKPTIFFRFLFCCVLILCSLFAVAQQYDADAVFESLRLKDSLIFEEGYNKCNFEPMQEIVSEDFEFFHDQGGMMEGKATFVEGAAKSICSLPYKARRALVEGSLEVYPLFDQGKLYGAIQIGKHRFYAKEEGKEERFTSIAIFTHVWILEDGNWRLRRVLSYDHKTKDE